MNRLALGTAQFGLDYGIANRRGRIPDDEARAILRRARVAGIDMLDTAIAYGDSETRLGAMGIAGWQVISKLPAAPEACDDISKWVVDAISGSLDRLHCRRLTGLLLHRPQQLLEAAGHRLYEALALVKRDGLVERVGVSIYDPGELDALGGRYRFDIVQAPFNILDHRLIETGWLRRLADEGVELHARSVFLQGLLLMRPDERPRKFDRWTSLWSRWEAWLSADRLSPLQACLRHVLSFPEISRVIVGVDGSLQLDEILEASRGPVPQVPAELHVADLALIVPPNWVSLS